MISAVDAPTKFLIGFPNESESTPVVESTFVWFCKKVRRCHSVASAGKSTANFRRLNTKFAIELHRLVIGSLCKDQPMSPRRENSGSQVTSTVLYSPGASTTTESVSTLEISRTQPGNAVHVPQRTVNSSWVPSVPPTDCTCWQNAKGLGACSAGRHVKRTYTVLPVNQLEFLRLWPCGVLELIASVSTIVW
ncbi:hypothetical protein BKA80DRAFT_255341 [Phyllosticta citrichinensis]